jgi:F0F1-type ATP synthase membrane subunit b/b'
MGEILSQLAQLFIQAIPTVIFVFVLYVILSRSFFGPLTAVLKKREEETEGAMERAQQQAAAAAEKARQYEAAFQAARQETYHLREATGRAIGEDREATLKGAHLRSEALLSEARASLAAEVAQRKKELESTSQSLGQEIAETLLGGARRDGAGRIQP